MAAAALRTNTSLSAALSDGYLCTDPQFRRRSIDSLRNKHLKAVRHVIQEEPDDSYILRRISMAASACFASTGSLTTY